MARPREQRGCQLTTEAAMEERRKVQRGRTLKAGSISFNGAGGIDCRVRNMSPVGACLEVSSQVGIPKRFRSRGRLRQVQAGVPRRLAFGHAPWRRISRRLERRKSTVDREKAAASARFSAYPHPTCNSLIGNQFPGFPRCDKLLCHRRNSRSLFCVSSCASCVF